MVNNPIVNNPNDTKVVSFHNSTSFGFTPEMGCMYDGRAINGNNGAPGIEAGQTIMLPYHIGHRLATNLAKRIFNTSQAASVDPTGIPTGVAIWNPEKLDELKNTFLKDLYSEEKPAMESETDKLMAKVEEYRKMTIDLEKRLAPKIESSVKTEVETSTEKAESTLIFNDKQEVLSELEKRGIKHDKRQSKSSLEKLLV